MIKRLLALILAVLIHDVARGASARLAWVAVCPDAGAYLESQLDAMAGELTAAPIGDYLRTVTDTMPALAKNGGVDLARGFREKTEDDSSARSVNYSLLRCGLGTEVVLAGWDDGSVVARMDITTYRRRRQWSVLADQNVDARLRIYGTEESVEPEWLLYRIAPRTTGTIGLETAQDAIEDVLARLPKMAQDRAAVILARPAGANGAFLDLRFGAVSPANDPRYTHMEGEPVASRLMEPSPEDWWGFLLHAEAKHQRQHAEPIRLASRSDGEASAASQFAIFLIVLFSPLVVIGLAGVLARLFMRSDDWRRVLEVLKTMVRGSRRILLLYVVILAIPPMIWGFIGWFVKDIGFHHAMRTTLRFVGGGMILYAVVLVGFCLIPGVLTKTNGLGWALLVRKVVLSRIMNPAFAFKGALTSIALLFFFLGFNLVGTHFTMAIGVGLFPVYAIFMNYVIKLFMRGCSETGFKGINFSPPEAGSRWDASGLICLIGMAVLFLYALTGGGAFPGSVLGVVCVLAYGMIWVTRNRIIPVRRFAQVLPEGVAGARGERILTGAAEAGTMFFWGAIFLPMWILVFQMLFGPTNPVIAVWAHEFWQEMRIMASWESVQRIGAPGWVGLVLLGSAVAYLIYEAAVVWHDAEAERHRVTCRGADWNNMLSGLEPFIGVGVSFWLLNEFMAVPLALLGVGLSLGGFLWFRLCKLSDDLFVGMRNEAVARTQQLWNATSANGEAVHAVRSAPGAPVQIFGSHLAALAGSSNEFREALCPDNTIEIPADRIPNEIMAPLLLAIKCDWQRESFGFRTRTGNYAHPIFFLIRHGKRLFSPSLDLARPLHQYIQFAAGGPMDFVWGEELRGLPGYANLRQVELEASVSKSLLDQLEGALRNEPRNKTWKYDNRYDSLLIAFQHNPADAPSMSVVHAYRDHIVGAYVHAIEEIVHVPLIRILQSQGYEELMEHSSTEQPSNLVLCPPMHLERCRQHKEGAKRVIVPYNFNRSQLGEGIVSGKDELWRHLLVPDPALALPLGAVVIDDDSDYINQWKEWQSGSQDAPGKMIVKTVSSVNAEGRGRGLNELLIDVYKSYMSLRMAGIDAAVITDRYMPYTGAINSDDDRLSNALYRELSSRFLIQPLVTSRLSEGLPDAQIIPKYTPIDVPMMRTELLKRLVCKPALARLIDETEWKHDLNHDVQYAMRSIMSGLHAQTGLKECQLLEILKTMST